MVKRRIKKTINVIITVQNVSIVWPGILNRIRLPIVTKELVVVTSEKIAEL
jgi:hypothetical protein